LEQLKLTSMDVQIINEDLAAEIKLHRELIRAGMSVQP
jgi:hypothetical protein